MGKGNESTKLDCIVELKSVVLWRTGLLGSMFWPSGHPATLIGIAEFTELRTALET